eukprot:gb/GECH01013597.1/.p1 GENE.gb/GECH01013597.1/~~gb/GECH01013597.1/.p1  ORF type:complete len:401 (+),score=81.53 gb/GECH01013597.1/:1-1203(+)
MSNSSQPSEQQQDQKTSQDLPQATQEAVLVHSERPDTPIVTGYDFNEGLNWERFFDAYTHSGFQASNLGKAIDIVNHMLNWRPDDDSEPQGDNLEKNGNHDSNSSADNNNDDDQPSNTRCKVFLGYTSNMASCGVRESIRFLVQHRMVDVVVATAGGIEEDLIKCLAPTHLGEFSLSGEQLRKKGINRIGNLLVPNDNYVKFEEWMTPILDAMVAEQKSTGEVWTPSRMIHRLGKEINNETSICYWAYRNNIPIFSPALTDGSIGDMVYFHSYRNPGLVLDIAGDIRRINDEATFAPKTGMIIIGGGLVKHHICNANLMRNGADFSVFINTGQEFDGSDSGARPDEAISWGKIRTDAKHVKVYAEATIVFPILVARSFARYHYARNQEQKNETKGNEKMN